MSLQDTAMLIASDQDIQIIFLLSKNRSQIAITSSATLHLRTHLHQMQIIFIFLLALTGVKPNTNKRTRALQSF